MSVSTARVGKRNNKVGECNMRRTQWLIVVKEDVKNSDLIDQ